MPGPSGAVAPTPGGMPPLTPIAASGQDAGAAARGAHPLGWRVAVLTLTTFAGMLAFESLKEEVVSPQLTRWQSHWITVSFATLVASVGSFLVLRIYEREVSQRRRAQTDAERASGDLEIALREMKGLADSLGASEGRLRTFLRLSSEGIARFELDRPLAPDAPPKEQVEGILRGGRLIECNTAFARMLRRPAGETLLGKCLEELDPPPELVAGLEEFVRGGYRLDTREQRTVHSDGSSTWTRAHLVGLVEGGYLTVLWLSQGDITAQKRAEEDLQGRSRILEAVAFCSARFLEPGAWSDHAAEALARLGEAAGVGCAYIFENSEIDGSLVSRLRHDWTVPGAPTLAADPQFRNFRWPAPGPVRARFSAGTPLVAAVGDLGVAGQELLGRVGIQSVLIVPVMVEERWWGLLGLGEFRHPRHWSTAEVEALRTGAAALGAAVLQERAETALRESEARFRTLIEEAPVAVSISRGGTTIYTNKKHDAMFRFDPGEDVPGRRIGALIAPSHRDEVVERARRRALGLDVPMEYEVMGLRRDGSEFPMHVAVASVPLADGPASVAFLTDITARKEADEALRASEKKYRDIFDFAPLGIYQARLDGTLITANDAFARLLGYEKGREVLDLRLAQDVYADSEERSRLIARYGAVGHGSNVEVQLKRRDGARFWSEMSSHAVKDAAGETLYFETFIHDITARKTAEVGLRESEERYRLLFEGNPLPMLVYDPGTLRLLGANAAAVRQFGYSVEELQRLSVLDLATPDNPDLERLQAGRGDRRPDVLHVGLRRQRRKDGSVVDSDLTSLSITFAGRLARLVLLRDVTVERRAQVEQERLRQALEAEAAEWQRTVDAVDTAILILDPAMRTTRMNRAARDLLDSGYRAGPERTPEELFQEEPWRTGMALTERARSTGAEASAQAKGPSGGRSWGVTAFVSAPSAGAEERIVLAIRDITRLVTLQESLRRSETMAALGAIVAGVAHEVRNPLFTISATLDAFESGPERRRDNTEYLKALRAPVARLNQLTRDLLEYGKPRQLKKAPATARELVRRSMRACAALARERGVELAEAVDEACPGLEVDSGPMEQVLQNLVANAVQHSRRGGQVRVVAAASDETVEFRVEDDGPGIRESDLPHLFEPFFSRRKGGTGLGLSIVERIVEAHGGRVGAKNNPGRGAAFTVRLPLATAKEG
jgi:PAS domain S-box-containing protein